MSATAPLRIALLGCGRIGQMHAQLLDRQIDGATVPIVFDIAEGAARAVADMIDAEVAASAADAIAADVDAVAICTSTDTHVELIIAAAEAGRAILCEKPVSLDLAAVDDALAAVDKAGVPIQIGFNRRFDPSHRAVRDAVAAGEIGDTHLVRISSRDPDPPPIAYIEVSGGIFLDMTIHDFDMARYVTGKEVDEVYAVGGVRVDQAIGDAGDLDTAVIVLTHTDGTITTIDNSRRAVYGYDQRVEVFGSGGMVSSENPLVTTVVKRTEHGTMAATLPYFFLDRYIPSYVEQWKAFVHAVTTGEPTPVGGPDGRAPLLIGLAAWRSIREQRPVRVEEIT